MRKCLGDGPPEVLKSLKIRDGPRDFMKSLRIVADSLPKHLVASAQSGRQYLKVGFEGFLGETCQNLADSRRSPRCSLEQRFDNMPANGLHGPPELFLGHLRHIDEDGLVSECMSNPPQQM